MRKVNGILSGIILILFLVHGISGGFQLLGPGDVISKALSYTLLLLIGAHTVIGIILTARTVRILRKTHAPYFRQNLLFWTRRLSGFLIMLLLFFHITSFSDTGSGYFRLVRFDRARLAASLLLVLAVAIHVISNVRPALITFGVRSLRERAADILFVLTVFLLFMAAAFIVYYLRWNTI